MSGRSFGRRAALAVGVAASIIGVAGGCGSSHPAVESIRAGTCLASPAASVSPSATGVSAAGASATGGPATGGPGGGRQWASVSLPCLNGSGDVRLGRFDRPTIITLWASWCPPCRAELPAISSFAAANAATIQVIGVDTADTHTGGTSMVADFGLSFPSVFDTDRAVLLGIGRINLPVTVFVAPGGRIRAVWDVAGLDQAHLVAWSKQYLGVEAAS